MPSQEYAPIRTLDVEANVVYESSDFRGHRATQFFIVAIVVLTAAFGVLGMTVLLEQQADNKATSLASGSMAGERTKRGIYFIEDDNNQTATTSISNDRPIPVIIHLIRRLDPESRRNEKHTIHTGDGFFTCWEIADWVKQEWHSGNFKLLDSTATKNQCSSFTYVQVISSGLYHIYGQITFQKYFVRKNPSEEKRLSLFLKPNDDDDGDIELHRNLFTFPSAQETPRHTCSFGLVRFLDAGDQLYLKEMTGDQEFLGLPAASFFGLYRMF